MAVDRVIYIREILSHIKIVSVLFSHPDLLLLENEEPNEELSFLFTCVALFKHVDYKISSNSPYNQQIFLVLTMDRTLNVFIFFGN